MNTPPKKGKLAYLNFGLNPPTNRSLIAQLQQTLGPTGLEVITLAELVSPYHPANLWEVARRYGGEMVRRHKPWRDCLLRTEWMFRRVQQAVASRLQHGAWWATLQTGSRLNGRVPGLPHFIYTDHTHLANLQYPDQTPHWMFPPAWIALEREQYQQATHLFTFSSNIAQSLVRDYAVDVAQVTCVHAGSNLPPPVVAPRAPAGKTVLFVGVDWERKGGPLLVQAFRRVVRVHPEARLVVIGCTPKLAEPWCQVLGKLPAAEVAPWFAQADIFCMPTRREPFGIVYIEAMLAELPIVATRLGALPDMVAEGLNGYLVESGDEEALAARLSTLLGDSDLRAAFGRNGALLAQKRYQWPRVVQNMLTVMRAKG